MAAFDRIMDYLNELGWVFNVENAKRIIRFGVKAENGKLDVIIHWQESTNIVKCFSILPNNIPENKRVTVVDFLNRANYGLNIGNFELDMEDGEVRYRTFLLDYREVDMQEIQHFIHVNLNMMDKYMSGILQVSLAGTSPADAIKAIEDAADDDLLRKLLND